MPNILIFGANCQDGYYLAEIYKKRGYDVLGISRTGCFLQGDVGSYELVEELVKSHKPDIIFHLAAASTTRHDVLFENHKTIGKGTLNVFDAVYRWHPTCKVFLTGSGLQFINTGNPIIETDPFEASSAYSVERIYSVYAARYFRTLGVRVYVGYLFHHESPYRKINHVSQNIVQAVKRIAGGSTEKLEIGDIAVEKEWSFAGDIAEGISVLVGQESVFEAVIGSGRTHTIKEWLHLCFTFIGEDWRNHVVIRGGYVSEYKRLVSNPKTMNSLGWSSSMDIACLAELMLEH